MSQSFAAHGPRPLYGSAKFTIAMLVCTTASAQIANEPLLTRVAPVRPNVLLMLDNTPSMRRSEVASQALVATEKPVRIAAQDAYIAYGNSHYTGTTLANYLVGTTNAGGVAVAKLCPFAISGQSPVNNEIYYNPKKRYAPNYDDSGIQNPNVDVAINPVQRTEIFLPIDFLNPPPKGSKPMGALETIETDRTSLLQSNDASLHRDVFQMCDHRLYYNYRLDKIGVNGYVFNTYKLVTDNFNFPISIAAVAAIPSTSGPYVATPNEQIVASTGQVTFSAGNVHTPLAPGPFGIKDPLRTDCAANVCTVGEEVINIANWRAHHYSRLKVLKTGVSAAFAGQPDTFRLGFSGLGELSSGLKSAEPENPLKPAPAISSMNTIYGVNDWTKQKPNFYEWINRIVTPAKGDTTLRASYNRAGQYYSNSSNSGPWGHTPWQPGSEAQTEHHACRKSFTILMSDGKWTPETPTWASAGNDIDGVVGPQIDHADGKTSYQYIPRDANDARSVGKADNVTAGPGIINTIADIALYYWSRDLRLETQGTGNTGLPNNSSPGSHLDGPFWQNMRTYTAGFGAVGEMTPLEIEQAISGKAPWHPNGAPTGGAASTVDDIIHAAHNGGGEYLALTDAATFATKLGNVVGSIAAEQYSQSGVVASTVNVEVDSKKFVPRYTSGNWWGNVEMRSRDIDGNESVVWQVVEVDFNKSPTGVTTIPNHAKRNIYTWRNSTDKGIMFDNLPDLVLQNLVAPDVANNASSRLTSTITQAQIDYIRGDRSNEGVTGSGKFRTRPAILGDIVNSTPVFIKDVSDFGYQHLPVSTPGQSSYEAYKGRKGKSTNNNGGIRDEGILFVGANDGMLHGFREGVGTTGLHGGEEVFAYIPRAVLGKLDQLTSDNYSSNHQFFVDGPLTESDAFIPVHGSSPEWTNMVLGSLGAGGRAIFAINTTDLDSITSGNANPQLILWERRSGSSNGQFKNMGYVTGKIQTGITASGEWVGVFGNGKYGDSDQAHLFVVNLSDGTVLKEFNTNGTTSNGLGEARVVRNKFGQIIGVYAGDLQGNMWRFDLSKASSSWTNGELLFSASDDTGKPQPITAAPAVLTRTDTTGYMVVFGTGKLMDQGDEKDVSPQSAYGIWDPATFDGPGTFSTVAKDKSELVAIKVAEETNADFLSATTGSSTNSSAASKYYNTSSSSEIDWAKNRGWHLEYNLAPGQRTIYSVEPLKQLVRIDTIAPILNAVSCTTSSAQGYNLLVSALTGLCKALPTLDTNGDGKFDFTDSQACIYSTPANGSDVVRSYLHDNGTETDRARVSSADDDIEVFVGEKVVLPETSAGSGLRRDWRQIFPRQ